MSSLVRQYLWTVSIPGRQFKGVQPSLLSHCPLDFVLPPCQALDMLFVTGKDGSIAEYDLDRLSPGRGLRLLHLHTLTGPAALSAGPSPTALTFAPPLPYYAHSSADTLLLVADDSHKLRLYNADTHTCVDTAVGPLHGGPVTTCHVFRFALHSFLHDIHGMGLRVATGVFIQYIRCIISCGNIRCSMVSVLCGDENWH